MPVKPFPWLIFGWRGPDLNYGAAQHLGTRLERVGDVWSGYRLSEGGTLGNLDKSPTTSLKRGEP